MSLFKCKECERRVSEGCRNIRCFGIKNEMEYCKRENRRLEGNLCFEKEKSRNLELNLERYQQLLFSQKCNECTQKDKEIGRLKSLNDDLLADKIMSNGLLKAHCDLAAANHKIAELEKQLAQANYNLQDSQCEARVLSERIKELEKENAGLKDRPWCLWSIDRRRCDTHRDKFKCDELLKERDELKAEVERLNKWKCSLNCGYCKNWEGRK